MSIVVGKANTTESIWTCDLCGRQDRRFDGEPHYGWGEDDCRTPHQLCPDCLIEMTSRMSTDAELIAALREAGHDDAAQRVQDTALAQQLRAAGHDELAQQIESKQAAAAAPAPSTSPPPPTRQLTEEERYQQALGGAVDRALRRAGVWKGDQ